MKPCLVDVNVVLALLARNHVHHAVVRRWSDGLDAGEACLCRFVQLGVVRLLGNRTVTAGKVLSALEGWRLTLHLLEDQRFEYVGEPPGIEAWLSLFLDHPANPGKLVSDAYLAAFAAASSFRIATLDRGFLKFQGLDLALLTQ